MNPARAFNGKLNGATWVGAILAILGLFLMNLNGWFFLLVAVGAIGPGLLRELGWIHDKDEFQLQSLRRAGFHAYLVGTLLAFVLVTVIRTQRPEIRDPQEFPTLFLTVLWFTWFLSALHAVWGARKAAFRILITFGTVWLCFMILSNIGKEWTGWRTLLLQCLLAVPFFGLAGLSLKWPKACGVLLLLVAIFFFTFFHFLNHSAFSWINRSVTMVLFLGPLLASGIALLFDAEPIDRDSIDE